MFFVYAAAFGGIQTAQEFLSRAEDLCEVDQSDDWDKINSAFELSELFFCEEFCPCNEEFKGAFDDDLQLEMEFSEDGANNILDCEPEVLDFVFDQSFQELVFPLVEKIEKEGDCSGLCTLPRTFIFKGVEFGSPEVNCIDSIQYIMAKQLNAL